MSERVGERYFCADDERWRTKGHSYFFERLADGRLSPAGFFAAFGWVRCEHCCGLGVSVFAVPDRNTGVHPELKCGACGGEGWVREAEG